MNFRTLFVAVALSIAGSSWAAEPYGSATITRVENRVAIGSVRGGRVEHQKPASINDVIRAEEYLQTETASRAEIQFADRTIVRLGQNTVFSFDAASRTLSLQKGAMLFYVPPGNGGNVKTPTLTAAITGTIVLGTPNVLAVVSGSLLLPFTTPSGKNEVLPGFALVWLGDHADVLPYNVQEVPAGRLWAMGPLPELPEVHSIFDPRYGIPDQRWWDIMDAVLNSNSRGGKKRDDDEDSPDSQDSQDDHDSSGGPSY